MTSAMILAAGLGTRLLPLTNELPKPLVWLGDKAMVAHIVDRLVAAGVARVVLNTHHLADAFEGLASLGLVVLREEAILGTAGGVANARAALGEGPVLVWNGDIAADVDVAGLLAAADASGAFSTLAVAAPAGVDGGRMIQGTVGLSASGDVVRLRGERFGEEVRSADFIGVSVLSPRARDRLPDVGCLFSDSALPALRRGERVATFAHERPWDDVGSLAAYLAANRRWLAGRPAFVGPGARVDAAVTLEGVVVGRGARVVGRGRLADVVVWPGATATAPLERAIVTPRSVIRVP